MLRNLRKEQRTGRCGVESAGTRDVRLAAVLSTIVALTVVVTAMLSWHADAATQRPFNLLGMMIHCMLVGVVGLLVATLIEQWFDR
jgi:hypothetical protein